jgi:hypothetical protein
LGLIAEPFSEKKPHQNPPKAKKKSRENNNQPSPNVITGKKAQRKMHAHVATTPQQRQLTLGASALTRRPFHVKAQLLAT